ncbi:MAG: ribosome silencing factor [Bacteroidetes bacterium]|nr:ribosome silencing factor [Bacteroidota bacterium]MBL6944808.1 ribosome silencing factor [Bacteroidales bacterium]
MQGKAVKDDAKNILKQVVTAMQDKKAHHIISLDLRKINDSISQFFVICHAPSTTQVVAIYDNVLKIVQKNCGIKPFHCEGYENSEWILIDYFDIIIHIFREDIRNFYKLEELWADAALKNYQSE